VTIRVSELYGPAPQGEGYLLGVAMPFLRVAGCNLSCSWCDSRYTWEKGYAYTVMTPAEIIATLEPLLAASGAQWVSITGGEPTLYASLGEVVKALRLRGVACIVETNGLRYVDWLDQPNVFVSCSPKLPGSGQDTPLRREKVRRFVVQRLASKRTWPATQFKFVVATPDDLAALPDYCADVGIPTDGSVLVYAQPDGYIQPVDRYLEALRWLQESAPTWVRVTPQVHRLVHGPDARSV
jgi:7-cyano-7-deazaguanosine (preQ0) biosynthesis protein QueE